MSANSGQLSGSRVLAAFSFMVQDPRGIIPCTRERSRFSSRFR